MSALPLLFNIYIEELVREAMEKTQEGITVGGRIVKAVRFADDQAMVAATQKGLQEIMTVLHDTSQEYEDKYEENKCNTHQQKRR